jgi:hypothetical protein
MNNPETGKCEFVGFYCKRANNTHGCLQAYLEDGKRSFNLISSESGLTLMSYRTRELATSFKDHLAFSSGNGSGHILDSIPTQREFDRELLLGKTELLIFYIFNRTSHVV